MTITVYILIVWACVSGCRDTVYQIPFAENLECLRAGDSVMRSYTLLGASQVRARCEARSWNRNELR
jgi:hypothetical protein